MDRYDRLQSYMIVNFSTFHHEGFNYTVYILYEYKMPVCVTFTLSTRETECQSEAYSTAHK